MDFSTKITIPKADFELHHRQQMMAIGSCFTENIGQKLVENKFSTLINPFGIVYNPFSIFASLESVIKNEKFEITDLVHSQELWHSFEHHGVFSGLNQEKTLENINSLLEKAHNFMKTTNVLLITLGTSIVYKNKGNGKIVANCHKFPANYFEKTTISVEEIVENFEKLMLILPKNIEKIIFTVSPVRHLKDGFIENQRSKARLILAIEAICKRFSDCNYFPAYEIVMDELRDYRFFERDMVHPNNMAIDYIWEKFCQTYFDENTMEINATIQKIQKAAEHRPFNYESESHQKFIQKQLEIIEKTSKKHPFLDFWAEKEILANIQK